MLAETASLDGQRITKYCWLAPMFRQRWPTPKPSFANGCSWPTTDFAAVRYTVSQTNYIADHGPVTQSLSRSGTRPVHQERAIRLRGIAGFFLVAGFWLRWGPLSATEAIHALMGSVVVCVVGAVRYGDAFWYGFIEMFWYR